MTDDTGEARRHRQRAAAIWQVPAADLIVTPKNEPTIGDRLEEFRAMRKEALLRADTATTAEERRACLDLYRAWDQLIVELERTAPSRSGFRQRH